MTIFENGYADRTAKYWNGSISRKEIQPLFDEYGKTLTQLHQIVTKLDMSLAFLFEKSGSTMGEFQAWVEAKALEFKNAQEAAGKAPVEAPKVTLE